MTDMTTPRTPQERSSQATGAGCLGVLLCCCLLCSCCCCWLHVLFLGCVGIYIRVVVVVVLFEV